MGVSIALGRPMFDDSQWGKQNVFCAGLATFGNTQVVSLSYSEISRSQVKPRACFPLPATPMFETPVALCAPNSQKRGGTKAPVRSNEAQSTKTCRLSSNTTFYIWAWWIVLNVRMFRFLGTQLGAIACAFSKQYIWVELGYNLRVVCDCWRKVKQPIEGISWNIKT